MKLKNNKGYVGVDVTIALMVLVILIPTITAMTFNINKTSNVIKRKTQAVSITSNIMENAKIVFMEEEGLENEEYIDRILSKTNELYEIDVEDNDILTIENTMYKMDVEIEDKDNEEVKNVKATVTYKSGNNEESISFNTNFAMN